MDHLVYCVPDLEEAMAFFRDQHGIHPVIGGKHLKKGTQNALFSLGNQCYLEILAIDESNTSIDTDRWMGIDHLTSPKLTRWSLKSDDLRHDTSIVNAYKPEMGAIEEGQRQTTSGKTLRWDMILPLSYPEVELIPFMVDWSSSETHPNDSLSDTSQLIGLSLGHPDPETVQKYLNELGINLEVVPSDKATITASIKGPKGNFQI